MGQNLFSVLISTIKSRFAPIVTKIRLWTSWNFIRTKITSGVRDFFLKVLNIKPKDKDDYYTIFGWMISKRLAYAIIIIIGVLSFWYISSATSLFAKLTEHNGLRTYKYSSVLLRLAEGKVRILGKSGFLAYEGEVSKGYVTGHGTLYSPKAVTLYDGEFEKNMFEGAGTEYYDSGALQYNGTFHRNLFEGSGTLFREDGTRAYEGGFVAGKKDGKGQLFDLGGDVIYDGNFSSDQIIFSELIGKSPEDIRGMYSGKQVMYENASEDGSIAMALTDIDALYYAQSDGSAADDTVKVESVCVLTDVFRIGEDEAADAAQLKSMLGEPVYEGNSNVTFPEAVSINILNDEARTFKGKVGMDVNAEFTDDIIVNSYDTGYSVYLYTFLRGDLAYTFVGRNKGGKFYFYEISKAMGNNE